MTETSDLKNDELLEAFVTRVFDNDYSKLLELYEYEKKKSDVLEDAITNSLEFLNDYMKGEFGVRPSSSGSTEMFVISGICKILMGDARYDSGAARSLYGLYNMD